jgi:hypothetical protein
MNGVPEPKRRSKANPSVMEERWFEPITQRAEGTPLIYREQPRTQMHIRSDVVPRIVECQVAEEQEV